MSTPKKVYALLPEFLVFGISIILIIFSSLNYRISPAPPDLKDTVKYTGSVFCLPVDKIDQESIQSSQSIRDTMNYGYQLMISTLILGIVLCLLSSYKIVVLCSSKSSKMKLA